ncbi:MAG: GxxExxY protein [Candidatus Methanoperedens sp.]
MLYSSSKITGSLKYELIELKAVTTITPLHEAQLLSYLKLSEKHLGLLINFNVMLHKDGIKRRIN